MEYKEKYEKLRKGIRITFGLVIVVIVVIIGLFSLNNEEPSKGPNSDYTMTNASLEDEYAPEVYLSESYLDEAIPDTIPKPVLVTETTKLSDSAYTKSYEEGDPDITPVVKITKMSQLNSGFRIKHYKLYRSDSVSAKIFGIGFGKEKCEVVIVRDYMSHLDTKSRSGNKIRVGVGLRLIVFVKSVKKGGDLGGLPKIAASVELTKAEATYQLEGVGFNLPDNIRKEVFDGSEGNFDVENFSKVSIKFDKIASILTDDNPTLKLNPAVIPAN